MIFAACTTSPLPLAEVPISSPTTLAAVRSSHSEGAFSGPLVIEHVTDITKRDVGNGDKHPLGGSFHLGKTWR
ncbi:hypothetical protein [Rhizobium leguminosarum]|uniref:hypothetical protein n=1 Tax=Rhizobium leguminosarum TaxID=384 RepID=UPI0024B3BC86|nr:hypothetical protein [Rhizobium leguminosarum]WHO80627.1 hypothetical protein QMO81_003345 [Rhizobium leguminosarum]